jgi:hypothetical protein
VGFTPTGKLRLVTAHTQSGHSEPATYAVRSGYRARTAAGLFVAGPLQLTVFPSATPGPHVQRHCIMSLLYSKIKREVHIATSCLKNGDVPKFPLPKIGSLVPSVGTISIRKIAMSGCRQHPPSSLHLLRAAHVPYIERTKAMRVPSMLQGESGTRVLQGIAIGAVASTVIGFSWGGWVTGSTANGLAAERADSAVVAALTPICVEKFLQNSDAKSNLAALQKISLNWEQGAYLEKGGWATLPGATSPDYHLARACAEKLMQTKPAAQ